jgi:hypothetical protein
VNEVEQLPFSFQGGERILLNTSPKNINGDCFVGRNSLPPRNDGTWMGVILNEVKDLSLTSHLKLSKAY